MSRTMAVHVRYKSLYYFLLDVVHGVAVSHCLRSLNNVI